MEVFERDSIILLELFVGRSMDWCIWSEHIHNDGVLARKLAQLLLGNARIRLPLTVLLR